MTYDRAAIMRDAYKRFRDGKRLGLGWTFGQCLATAWSAAKDRRKSTARGFAAWLRGIWLPQLAGFDLLFAGAETPRPWNGGAFFYYPVLAERTYLA